MLTHSMSYMHAWKKKLRTRGRPKKLPSLTIGFKIINKILDYVKIVVGIGLAYFQSQLKLLRENKNSKGPGGGGTRRIRRK